MVPHGLLERFSHTNNPPVVLFDGKTLAVKTRRGDWAMTPRSSFPTDVVEAASHAITGNNNDVSASDLRRSIGDRLHIDERNSTMVDQQSCTELKLFTENDGDIYRQTTTPIVRNLRTKQAAGKYNRDLAVKLFMYLAEAGARKYAREFGSGESTWHEIFPIDVRRQAATEWRDEFEQNSADGQYDNLTYLPKKYLEKLQGNSPYKKGDRVAAQANTDAFMMGDRYGDVSKVSGGVVHVKMDKSRKTKKFKPADLELVENMDSRRL